MQKRVILEFELEIFLRFLEVCVVYFNSLSVRYLDGWVIEITFFRVIIVGKVII